MCFKSDTETLVVQAGASYIDCSEYLMKYCYQLTPGGLEIGNIKMGTANISDTKSTSNEFSQLSGGTIVIKYINYLGEKITVTEEDEEGKEELRKIKTSCGLMGIIYEIEVKVRKMRIANSTYSPMKLCKFIEELKRSNIDKNDDPNHFSNADAMMCFHLPNTDYVIVEKNKYYEVDDIVRKQIDYTYYSKLRSILWGSLHSVIAAIDTINISAIEKILMYVFEYIFIFLTIMISNLDGVTNYENSRILKFNHPSIFKGKYIFDFWAPNINTFESGIKNYSEMIKKHELYNIITLIYFIKSSKKSYFSYCEDSDVFTIDTISPSMNEKYKRFILEKNKVFSKIGKPAFTQSLFLSSEDMLSSYGSKKLSEFRLWVKERDPMGMFLTPEYNELFKL